jgi:hypothetical protein
MTHPLFRAIKFGTMPMIGAVLDAGAYINTKVERRRDILPMTFCSPIEMAFERGDKAVLEFLLSRGATMPPWVDWPRTKRLYNAVPQVAIANGSKNVPIWKGKGVDWPK